MAVLYVLFALVPVLVSLLLQPMHLPHPFLLESKAAHYSPPRILLLTAHPDDETFFFGPTLTSLIPPLSAPVSASSRERVSDTVAVTFPQVYSLCFSVGNADKLGNIRRREFGDSLDLLGVTEDRRWILDKSYVSQSCHVLFDTGSSQG
jgi:N-acetylglucosaminylphosphatidylinositol deacetylase